MSNKTDQYFLLFAHWKSSILDQQLYNFTNLLQKFLAFVLTSMAILLNTLAKLFMCKTIWKRKNNVFVPKGYRAAKKRISWILLISTNLFLKALVRRKRAGGYKAYSGAYSTRPRPFGNQGWKGESRRRVGMHSLKRLEKHSGQEMPEILKLPSSYWPGSR